MRRLFPALLLLTACGGTSSQSEGDAQAIHDTVFVQTVDTNETYDFDDVSKSVQNELMNAIQPIVDAVITGDKDKLVDQVNFPLGGMWYMYVNDGNSDVKDLTAADFKSVYDKLIPPELVDSVKTAGYEFQLIRLNAHGRLKGFQVFFPFVYQDGEHAYESAVIWYFKRVGSTFKMIEYQMAG
ncbi:MAG: hypothetical protein H6551_11050 [Chitinophagales bacterium]|nr:hypothetical protein [Chitinophagaceae bacterium]MCB9065662.1 hypothetical protein [Chitinophagales bacterium]